MSQFNKRALEAGYDLTPLEERVEWRLSITRSKPPIVSLAATMCARAFHRDPRPRAARRTRAISPAPIPRARALWRWHAIEEIEHKGVAYDTWLHATRDWPRCKRWKVKAKVMLFVTRNFIVDRSDGTLELLRQDGITGLARLGADALVRLGAAGHAAQDPRRLGRLLPARLPPLEP